MGARRERGFTLIEVVAAFVLLSLVLASAFQIFTTGLQRAGELEDYSRALVVAQSKLAAAGLDGPLEEGETRGESEDRRYRWAFAVRRGEENVDPGGPAVSLFNLYRLDVRVEWDGSDGRARHVELATLLLGPRT